MARAGGHFPYTNLTVPYYAHCSSRMRTVRSATPTPSARTTCLMTAFSRRKRLSALRKSVAISYSLKGADLFDSTSELFCGCQDVR
jgi:hypothetical protein